MDKISSVQDIRSHFPALNQKVNGKQLVYLDNGATSQKPEVVISLINRMNSYVNGNIHRAVHELSAQTTVLYEQARESVRGFLNASKREEIIFTSGTTSSINLVAAGFAAKYLKKGDAVLISEAEHHSNIVPWQMACERTGAHLRVIPVDENGCWEMDKLSELLDSKVKIVSVAHVSNVIGVVNPVKEIISLAHSMGIPVLVDGAQGIVHSKVDVQDLDCDFYVFSGHKLFAPTGTGILYGKFDLLNDMPPWMGGGDMVESVSIAKTTYAQLPLKFEAGTPNFIGIAGLGAAIEFLNTIDFESVHNNEKSIVNYLLKELCQIPGLRVYGVSENKIPLFSMTIDGVHPTDAAMIMDKMGVALRSGLMCSEPLMHRFDTNSMLRASFAMYNTVEEAAFFVESLKRAIKMLS